MPPSAPLVALKGADLRFGRQQLFEDLAFGLGRGEHACLVGRNGTGKSSLLKVLAGLQDLDAGERFVQPGTTVAYLPQDPRLPSGVTVADFVAGDGDGGPARHQVDAVLKRLALDGARDVSELSGGEGRRASLAKALVGDPDVLFLDEPTNHLDLPTIEWLETELSGFPGGLLVISHDRTFLSKVSRATYWLDRGHLRHLDKSFAAFEDWADAILTREAQAQHRLERQIVREERWLHKGITARRKRNQGRLARLQEMRAARREWLAAPGRVQVTAGQNARSGDRVIEAEGLSKTYPGPDGAPVTAVRDFSTRIRRGDRIGVIGPNGAGKTTLVRMLIGALAPDSGRVTLGHKVEPLYFDQTRESLDRAATLWQTLVPGGGDSLLVQGRQRHVVSYLRDFLFDESQARQPVKSLSGGERNRLLLARLFAQPGNLLVMDEPTNDLDLETAELLVDILAQFDGTVLLVSHDRDFLDRSVTGLFVFTGDGRIEDHVGGYSDYLARRGAGPGKPGPGKPGPEKPETPAVARPKSKSGKPKRTGAAKLSYKEQHELAGLPAEIDRLTAEVERLEAALADPELYARDPDGFTRASNGLAAARQALHTAEDRWLELEARRESLRAGPEPATKTEESRAPASRA